MNGIVAHASFDEVLTDPEALGQFFAGPSWSSWLTIAKAAFGVQLNDEETAFFKSIADRDPPKRRVRELWIIAGRRAGKDSFASALAAWFSGCVDFRGVLRPGEKMTVMCLACDRRQARIVANYTRGYFHRVPMLSALIENDVQDGFDLVNGNEVRVFTNSIASIRGVACSAIILDEVAFFSGDDGAASAKEVYTSALPTLASANGMLIGISTPYRKSGLLYEKFTKHFGKSDRDVLVIVAPSLTLNPTLDANFIAEQLEIDPEAAGSEWNATWRSDIGSLVDPALVARLIAYGRYELPRISGTHYFGYTDPSGGSADSWTLAICHVEKGVAVVDVIRERRPPFSPSDVAEDYSQLLKSYGVHTVRGDRYGGEFPRELFKKNGIAYELSERTASEIYLEMLPIINSGRVEFLDHRRCIAQLIGLERRTSRAGKDTVSHGPGSSSHDDIINAVSGVVVRALGGRGPMIITEADVRGSLVNRLGPSRVPPPVYF